ncbi:MAG: 3-deoxy-D-arabino-heptulosonate 7-phosphate synthase [Puniceicoccaceae bacterium]
MIISKEPRLTREQLAEVERVVAEFDCKVMEIVGAHRAVYAILGDERKELMFSRLAGLPYVDHVDQIDSPYRLLDRRSRLAGHTVKIGKVDMKADFLWIAGPCTVDPKNPALAVETALMVKEAGCGVLRGGIWKPRTMPYSYQGEDRALEILLEARERTGLPLNVEVMDERQLGVALEAGVEMLQIGTRNALNYSLLRKVGEMTAGKDVCVLLKRSRAMAPLGEFIAAAEYIVAGGNANVLLCPRGTLPGLEGYRNHPDECCTPLLKEKTWAPVVVDPSHSVGHARYVGYCALAAVAYGADGLCVEAHIKPSAGIGDDPKQALSEEELKRLVAEVDGLRKIRGCQSGLE